MQKFTYKTNDGNSMKIFAIAFVLIVVGGWYWYLNWYLTKEDDHRISNMSHLRFPDTNLLQEGDLVFRRGYGVDSTVAMNFSEGEKRYSHAGLLVKRGGVFFVVHSEDDAEHGHYGIYPEPLREFLKDSPVWGVYRFKLSRKTRQKIAEAALHMTKRDIKFDYDFDLHDDDKMYCTEFIYKTVNRTVGKTIIRPGKRFMSRDFVTISDLYENDLVYLVQRNDAN